MSPIVSRRRSESTIVGGPAGASRGTPAADEAGVATLGTTTTPWSLQWRSTAATSSVVAGLTTIDDTPACTGRSSRPRIPARTSSSTRTWASPTIADHRLGPDSRSARSRSTCGVCHGPGPAFASRPALSDLRSEHSSTGGLGNEDGTFLALARRSARQALEAGRPDRRGHHGRAGVRRSKRRVRHRSGQLPEPRLADRDRQRRVPGRLRRRDGDPAVHLERRIGREQALRRREPRRARTDHDRTRRRRWPVRGGLAAHVAPVQRQPVGRRRQLGRVAGAAVGVVA